jgi:hypothetical protein
MAALLIAGAMIHACGGGGSSGGGAVPAIPPPPGPTSFIVNFRFPASGATNVPRGTAIYIGFNNTVNPATVTSANVRLLLGAVEQATSLFYDPCLNRVRIVPGAPLNPSMIYTVDLTAGVTNNVGTALTPTSYDFTSSPSADGVRPVFDNTGNASMAVSITEVQLDWNDASDNVDLAGALFYDIYQATPAGCFNFAAAPTATVGPGVLTAQIGGLLPRTNYSFIVRARDSAGNQDLNVDIFQVTTMTSFSQNVRPIVTTSCVACHNPGGTATQAPYFINMNYTTNQTNYDSWVNQNSQCATALAGGFGVRVVPFDSTTSFLFNKIDANPPACGVTMPFGQQQLQQADRNVIRDWIDEGALNN